MLAAPPFDTVSYVGIELLAIVVGVVWMAMIGARFRAVWVAGAAWFFLTSHAARSGWFQRFDRFPPPMPLLLLSLLCLALLMGLSPLGRAAAARPMAALIGLQAFRLPLELIMHRAATLGIAPLELTYSGYNFDIVTGAAAAVLAALLVARVSVPRPILWIWNGWGAYSVAAIIVIAMAGSPIVHAFGEEPRHIDSWLGFFPYIWVPAVFVVVAIAGHIVITRKLIART
jgi:hypothetical protein